MQGRLGVDRDVVEAVGLDPLLGFAIRIHAGPEQESYALRRIRPLPALGHGNMQQVLALIRRGQSEDRRRRPAGASLVAG